MKINGAHLETVAIRCPLHVISGVHICMIGPLDMGGGVVLMSHVDFRKCQRRMSLSLFSCMSPAYPKKYPCPM